MKTSTGCVIQKKYSYLFSKIYRKTPVAESFFDKVESLKLAMLLKRDSGKVISLRILPIF